MDVLVHPMAQHTGISGRFPSCSPCFRLSVSTLFSPHQHCQKPKGYFSFYNIHRGLDRRHTQVHVTPLPAHPYLPTYLKSITHLNGGGGGVSRRMKYTMTLSACTRAGQNVPCRPRPQRTRTTVPEILLFICTRPSHGQSSPRALRRPRKAYTYSRMLPLSPADVIAEFPVAEHPPERGTLFKRQAVGQRRYAAAL